MTMVANDRPLLLSQVSVLKAIAPIKLENVVLGQYTGSEDGSQPGYKDGERPTVANNMSTPDSSLA